MLDSIITQCVNNFDKVYLGILLVCIGITAIIFFIWGFIFGGKK